MDADPDVHGYEYISISWAGSSPSGKTQKYSVTNNKSVIEIGTISWYGSWRQYVFTPHDGTLYSAGCLKDIADFLVSLRLAKPFEPTALPSFYRL